VRFGRHICAVGGNAEASRRAGIKVRRVRVVVFALCSAMAAVGGIMAASRLFAVNQSSGGSDLLLLAIAGPVIAGTSQGVRSALLDDVVAVVESLRREETAAIGIGVPSIVELATGRIRYSLNIPLIDLPRARS
jgi:predicted ABC-type sugar transport system permease subunit